MCVGYVLEDGDVEVPPLTCGPVLAVGGVDAVLYYAVVGEGFGEALGRFFVFVGSENADLVVTRVALGNMGSHACCHGFDSGGRTEFLHRRELMLNRYRTGGGMFRAFRRCNVRCIWMRRGTTLSGLAVRALVSAFSSEAQSGANINENLL